MLNISEMPLTTPKLTVIQVNYIYDRRELFGAEYVDRCTRTFLDSKVAAEFAKSVEDAKITTTETSSYIYTGDKTSPWFRLDYTNVVILGDYETCRGSYLETAYTSKEFEKLARAEFARQKEKELKAANSYYNKSWV